MIMKINNMNKGFMDQVLNGKSIDALYHLGICSDDPLLNLMKDLRAVVMAGSPDRVKRMAENWSQGSKISKFPKDERFSAYYTNGVLFCSHGMGMPSMSIALQELMKLVYYVKKGSVEEMEKVMWFRIGTSGGFVEPGTVVLTTQALCADLKPYKLFVLGKEKEFDPSYPESFLEQIIKANDGKGVTIIKGKTVGANSFYIEQNRIDGGIALCTETEKLSWLKEIEKQGIRNIEMETPVMAAFLNHWGFPKFAAICCVLVNRTKGDQVKATKEELESYSLNAEKVLLNTLS